MCRPNGDTAETNVPIVLRFVWGWWLRLTAFPLAFEIFDGNRPDVTTTREMVQMMENKYGKAHRVWVMDRGMAQRREPGPHRFRFSHSCTTGANRPG